MSFDNFFSKNAVIFDVDNSSSFNSDNRKNKFLVLGEITTDGINDTSGRAEEKIRFSKEKTKFCLSLHYNGNESYMYVNETEVCKIEANDNINR